MQSGEDLLTLEKIGYKKYTLRENNNYLMVHERSKILSIQEEKNDYRISEIE